MKLETNNIFALVIAILLATAVLAGGGSQNAQQISNANTPTGHILCTLHRNASPDLMPSDQSKEKNHSAKPTCVITALLEALKSVTKFGAHGDVNPPAHHDKNVFKNHDPQFLSNSINFNPKKVWYENGCLYAEMFVSNGYTGPVYVGDGVTGPIYNYINMYNINVKTLRLSNSDGVIAEASFGIMDGVYLAANQYTTWTFCFPPDCVMNNNADLTHLITDTSSNYSW